MNIIDQLYTTYIKKAAEAKVTAVSLDDFTVVFQRSQEYISKLGTDSGTKPYVVIPIPDGKLFFLAQVDDGSVKIGIHPRDVINRIVGDEVIKDTE